MIVIIVAVLIIVVMGCFLFLNKGGSIGIDKSLHNENNKQKVLVVYFTETGNTGKLAKLISDEVGGDFRRIETCKLYSTGQELL